MPSYHPRLSVDEAFDLLSSARRRRILRHLLDDPESTVYQRALSARLATEAPVDPESIEAALVHIHLPKLVDAGIIEYEYRTGTIRPTDAAEEIRPLLETVDELWKPALR